MTAPATDPSAAPSTERTQTVVTLDMEGVLVPEIWIAVAERTGIEALRRTTREFLAELRRRTQVVILSDTFEQFAAPLMRQLGMPTILCHRLVVESDRITDYRIRIDDPKRRAVQAFQGLNYRVIAAGDSYNDTTMLLAAEAGFLFHAPDNVKAEFPQPRAIDDYDTLLDAIDAALRP